MVSKRTDKERAEDRQLQIRIAQINARLQIQIAAIFGFIAGGVGFSAIAYPLVIENYPPFTPKSAIGLLEFGVALSLFVIAIIFTKKAFESLNDFNELK